jgi:hypothetical protein
MILRQYCSRFEHYWAIIAGLLTACISGSQNQAYPLYPHTQPLPREQLAHLTGYIQIVDGRDVSTIGTSFDLLPGCHVVVTPEQWGHTELNAGGMSMNTGHLAYAFPMKAGYTYAIRVQMEKKSGTVLAGNVEAHELDAAGVVTRTFDRVAPSNTKCEM